MSTYHKVTISRSTWEGKQENPDFTNSSLQKLLLVLSLLPLLFSGDMTAEYEVLRNRFQNET